MIDSNRVTWYFAYESGVRGRVRRSSAHGGSPHPTQEEA